MSRVNNWSVQERIFVFSPDSLFVFFYRRNSYTVLNFCCLFGLKWVSLMAIFLGCLCKKGLNEVFPTICRDQGMTLAINNCKWIQPVCLLSLSLEDFGNNLVMAFGTRINDNFPVEFVWNMDQVFVILSVWLICAYKVGAFLLTNFDILASI